MTFDVARFDPVLVVEDNLGDADLIEELLLSTGFAKVVHAERLSSALSSLSAGPCGAILLDLGLPDGSGVECVETIRAHAPDLPIVILTGREDDALAHACLVAGAQDYFSKAEIRAETLRRSIGYAVARAEAGVERRHAFSLQQRLAAIVESSSDAIVSTDVEGFITSWNRGAEEIFGYTADEAVGSPLRQIVRVPEGAGVNARDGFAGATVLDGSSREPALVERLHKNGAIVQLSVVASRLRDADGVVVGIAAIGRDITELRRRGDELRERNEELVARDRQMRALTARWNEIREDERARISREVHDELGQLLTGLKMDVHWIRKRVAAKVTDVAALSERLAEADGLVDATIATVQRIALELRPSALDVLGLPAALRDEARRFEKRSGIRVSTRIPDAVRPVRPESATALFRISQELLTNVARHARASAVSIDLEQTDDALVLRIADDGVGISSEGASRRSSLGLLGIRERAGALGGVLSIEGLEGGGTLAVVRLPHDFHGSEELT